MTSLLLALLLAGRWFHHTPSAADSQEGAPAAQEAPPTAEAPPPEEAQDEPQAAPTEPQEAQPAEPQEAQPAEPQEAQPAEPQEAGPAEAAQEPAAEAPAAEPEAPSAETEPPAVETEAPEAAGEPSEPSSAEPRQDGTGESQAADAAAIAPAPASRPADARDGALSLLGTGLLTLPDTGTMAPRRVAVATTLYNRDRDPLGIDVFDYSLAFTAGVTRRIEAYGRGVFSRVVVVPDVSGTSPALPPPPLDLVVMRGTPIPPRPYYSFYAPLPYANGQGDQRFSDMVPGDFIGGVKMRLREPSGRRPGLAASAEIQLPLTRRVGALQSGAGTGGIDVSARLTSEWQLGRYDVVASGEFTRVGAPALPDRIVVADQNESSAMRQPLRLPNRLELGAGVRRPVLPRLAALAEVVATFEVSGQTSLLDSAPPMDFLLGLQTRAGRARLTTGLLYHGRSLRSGVVRPSPLAGFVDLTKAGDAGTRQYLQEAGLASAMPLLRPGAQRVAPLVPDALLPQGARPIPETYTILSEHQMGLVFVLGWVF